jgi:hypothetical protein
VTAPGNRLPTLAAPTTSAARRFPGWWHSDHLKHGSAASPYTVPSGQHNVVRSVWRLVDRLQLPDAEALELIAYAGRIGPSGKRPRFRLSTRQTHLASYLPEIEAALQAIGETPGWLVRRNRSVPFRGRSPVKLMAERDGEGMGDVLQFLNRAVLRRSLG